MSNSSSPLSYLSLHPQRLDGNKHKVAVVGVSHRARDAVVLAEHAVQRSLKDIASNADVDRYAHWLILEIFYQPV